MREIRQISPDVPQLIRNEEMDRFHFQSEVPAQIYSALRRPSSDTVYQLAIIVAALLVVVTASLF
jgi:hypothetical protein